MNTPDPELNSLDSVPAAGSLKAPPKRSSQRRRRLREYRCHALAHPDPLQANLCATNADLMDIANGLGNIIRSALRGSANPLQDHPELLKVLQTYYNFTRMMQRFTMLDDRFRPPPPDATPPSATTAELPEGADDKGAEPESSFPDQSPKSN